MPVIKNYLTVVVIVKCQIADKEYVTIVNHTGPLKGAILHSEEIKKALVPVLIVS